MKDQAILKGKNILITGGAGFIGSNLCEYFLSLGGNVTCLDNLSTGFYKNIASFIKLENFTFIEVDIRDLNACLEACENQDYVFHQAALGSVPRSIHDPITTNNVNITGFLNMLIAARDMKVKRFIYAASSSTYGDSENLPKVEEIIGNPLSPYAITKYVNELYADNFKLTYGLDTIGLRYFNVFGRRQDPNGAYAAVIPKFVLQYMAHESPVINGDGSYSRDFTYIDNVVQMNVRALSTTNNDGRKEVYNTAVGDRTSVQDLAEKLRHCLKKYDPEIARVEISHGPNRQGDVPHSLASIAKAESKLEYRPTHRFDDGLKEA